jgi:hypothetical protein
LASSQVHHQLTSLIVPAPQAALGDADVFYDDYCASRGEDPNDQNSRSDSHSPVYQITHSAEEASLADNACSLR